MHLSQSFQLPSAPFPRPLGFRQSRSFTVNESNRSFLHTKLYSKEGEQGEKADEVEKEQSIILNEGYEDDSNPSSHDSPERMQMDLFWCGREECKTEELREKVVGKHNEIMFDHPATGQVAYKWNTQKTNGAHGKNIQTPRVLILVKRNDDELLKAAADVSFCDGSIPKC